MSFSYEIEGAIEIWVEIGPEYENYDESSKCNVFKFETIEEFMNWSRISVDGEKQLYSILNKAKSFWQVTDGPFMVEWSNFDVSKLIYILLSIVILSNYLNNLFIYSENYKFFSNYNI